MGIPHRPFFLVLADQSDEELATEVAKSNHQAFSLLVERHHLRFYRLAYRHLLDQAEAEDLVQDCYVKFWQRPETWQAGRGTKFTTWFSKVVINACLDHHRRKKPVALMEGDLARWEAEQAEHLSNAHSADRDDQTLQEAMLNLPDRQRMAVNLVYYEQMSNQAAADAMGLKLKALQSLIMRAKGHLKHFFAEEREKDEGR